MLAARAHAPRTKVGLEQTPVDESQVPGAWHWSSAVQTLAVPEHVPAVQVSDEVHSSPSSQAVPVGWQRGKHG